MSERLDAADIADLLTDYFTLMTEVLFRWEGTLDKYLGDGLLAIFGAPVRCVDHGLRAVRCALEMLEKQNDLPPACRRTGNSTYASASTQARWSRVIWGRRREWSTRFLGKRWSLRTVFRPWRGRGLSTWGVPPTNL
ncbi:MAG: adenylate/guanylate cyclase domain-containing protein [Desulfobacterales bacterium]|nr:adenylate/guanylate cyclase domain-containing protein [Desulfobacterales bacterium]